MAAAITVAGGVSADGNVLNGTGFDVIRSSKGQFTVNFHPAFNPIHGVVATQVSHFPTGDTRDNAVIVDFTDSSVNIITGKSDGKLEDRPFNFVAYGIQ